MKLRKKIFIPFIDGMLNYDCRECRNPCCSQSGLIIMNTREKRRLLLKYPFLRYFFVKETGKTYWVKRDPPCWFLEKDGLCHIQKRFGYSFKPFVCRLHPVHFARCAGEYVALLDDCPTLHVNWGSEKKNISHARIYKQVQEAIDNDIITEEIPWSAARLDLEKKILDGSKMFMDCSNYLDFAAYQASITTKAKMAKTRSRLLESVELWKSFFKIEKLSLDNRKLTRELVALTAVLRAGNRSCTCLRHMEVEKIPLALLALYFYMILFLKTRETGVYLETYTGILNGTALALLNLAKEDLKIRNRPLEARMKHLHLLQELHARKLTSRVEKRKENID